MLNRSIPGEAFAAGRRLLKELLLIAAGIYEGVIDPGKFRIANP